MNAFYSDSLVIRNRLLADPRCHTMAWIGVTGLALSAGGMAYGMSGAGKPQQPNLSASSAQLSNVEADMLPIQRQLEAAAQAGEATTVNLPQHMETQQFIQVPANSPILSQFAHGQLGGKTAGGAARGAAIGSVIPGLGTAAGALGGAVAGKLFGHKAPQYVEVPYNPADWEEGGKFAGQKPPGNIISKQVNVPAGPHTFDFKGLGAADIQSTLAKANAKSQLALSQKYDPQFIAAAKAQEDLANPEGAAARQRMDELVQEQISRPNEQPVADELNRQLSQRIAAGKGLDEFDTSVLNKSVQDSLGARGGGGAQVDWSRPLTTGFAGEQRRLAGIGESGNFLASGTTPEDVAYRRSQQNMANLSAEMSGQTPVSEFASLSGARNGPTPTANGQPLPLMQGNTSGAAGSAAAGAYSTGMGYAANQANPWFTGLSSVINAASTAGNLGFRPFA